MPETDKTLLPLIHARVIQRLAVAGVLAIAVAACSSDTLRFGDNPFSNPFNETRVSDKATTGNLGYSPTMPVQSAPLAPPQQVAQSAVPQAPVGQIAAINGSAKGWTAQGGSSIYVGTSDTLATLSGRYNVPSAAILAANGLTSPAQITPGQRITIPVYNPAGVGGASTAIAAAPAAQPTVSSQHMASLPAAAPRPVQRADTAPNSLDDQASKLSQGISPKTTQAPAAKQVASLPTTATDVKPQATASQPIATSPASNQGQQAPKAASAPADEEKAGFRWPARGRVISGFGNGNEGINIAVPEGTPVKAAEGGVVAYAGNELKGYGNLVLIRHDNGWVSAYANNGELKVKRGDTVTRGQTIAKSGQTGNVTSPQLHFELRKGSKPVDPLPHLAGL